MAVYFGQEKGLGDLLGAGLGSGLSQLAQQKMQQIQTRKGLEGFLGPNMARQISQLPPEIAKQVIGQKLKAAQQQEMMNRFQQQYPGQQPGVNPGLETLLAGQQQQSQPVEGAEGLSQLQPSLNQVSQPRDANGYVPGRLGTLASALGVDPGKAMELELKAKEKAKDRSLAERKFESAENERAYKKVEPFISKVDKAQSVLGDEDIALAQIEEEMESGDIISPQAEFALSTLGVKNPSAMIGKPSGEMIQAALKTWLKNIREYFGARPVQFEVEKLMDSLPTLMNSQEGRRRIITSSRALNKLKQATSDSKNKIVKENKGKYIGIEDLQSRVYEDTKGFHNKIKSQLTGVLNLSNIMRGTKGIIPLGQKFKKDGNTFIYRSSGWDILDEPEKAKE